MSFNISIIINLKKSNMSNIEDIIKESSINCNVKSIYYDYDIEGINNYIKKNNKIIILEFDNEENLINFLKFIINIKELTIEYIYYENSILYCSNKYLNNISETLHNKKKILNTIEENKKSNNYKKIYNILS